MDRINKGIEFNTENLLKGISHFSKTNAVITSLIHSLKNYHPDNVKPLEVDGLPLIFHNDKGKIVATHADINCWVFNKAIEGLIAGLTLSLQEAYILVRYQSISLRSEQTSYSEKEMETKIKKINDDVQKKHFPTLIKGIENELKSTLAYREEIISFNQLRNCLVHRVGIVSKNDVNNPEKNALILKYRVLLIHAITPNAIIPLTKEAKANNIFVNNLIPDPDIRKELIVAIGDEIHLNAETYHGVLYTSVNFIHELIHKMPIPEDMKERLIPPYIIH